MLPEASFIIFQKAKNKLEVFQMNSKTLISAARVLSLLLLASGTYALTQERRPVHFSGLFND
jgi:hypothetical protein